MFFTTPGYFFFGTFAPFLRASESPIAMACFRLLTLFPLFPDFSFPRFCLCAAVRTLCLAFRLYFRGIRPPQRIREAPETPTRARCAYPMFRLHKKSLSVSGQNPLPVVKSRGLAMEIVQWKPGCETYYGRMLKSERGKPSHDSIIPTSLFAASVWSGSYPHSIINAGAIDSPRSTGPNKSN